MSDEGFHYGYNAREAGEGGGVDDFLKTRTRGTYESNVINEKHIKDAGEEGLSVVLMAKRVGDDRKLYNLRWVYPWVKRVEAKSQEGGDAKEMRVWMNPLNSYDGKDVHLDQKKRRNGERKVPPTDPFGRFSECVYQAVRNGEIDWLEPICEFRSVKVEETRLFRAGAFFGAYGEYNLSPAQIKEMVAVGITPRDAWKHELLAKGRFAFYVSYEGEAKILDVHDGYGKKIRDAIDSAMKDYRDKGHPLLNPYPVKVIHHKNRAGSDKIEVRALIGAPIQEEDAEAIRGEVADDADLLALYDVDKLRAQIEAHAVSRKLVLPWLDASFPASSSASKSDGSTSGSSAGGPVYECCHCGAATLRDGVYECSACGATVDEDNNFVTRPCTNCKSQVMVGEIGVEVSCAGCGAVHRQDPCSKPDPELAEDEQVPDWTYVRLATPPAPAEEQPEPAPVEAPAKRRRRAKAS